MITIDDIMEQLDVTYQQVNMAIYSGYLPQPTIDGIGWEQNHIDWFINNWRQKIERTKKSI